MSLTIIDDLTYQTLLCNEIARQINNGLDLKAARSMARETMARCFVADDDTQDSHDRERAEMNMTTGEQLAWHNPTQGR